MRPDQIPFAATIAVPSRGRRGRRACARRLGRSGRRGRITTIAATGSDDRHEGSEYGDISPIRSLHISSSVFLARIIATRATHRTRRVARWDCGRQSRDPKRLRGECSRGTSILVVQTHLERGRDGPWTRVRATLAGRPDSIVARAPGSKCVLPAIELTACGGPHLTRCRRSTLAPVRPRTGWAGS